MYICDDPICDPCCDFCWYCSHDEFGAPAYCIRSKHAEFSDGSGYCDDFRCALHEAEPDDFNYQNELKRKEQTARVIHMEALCDEIKDALSSEDVKECLAALIAEIQELEEYYEGTAWREDFDAERQGVFPKNLKRGILAEDTLYNLLCDVDQAMAEREVKFLDGTSI